MFKSNNLRSRAATLPVLITLLAVFTVGIENQSSANAGTVDMLTITGSVWYRERMMVPPDAEISVSLEDVSRMDVSAEVIATTGFAAQGGPPWDFSLEYNPRKLNDKGRYGLRVRIEVDGRLMFVTTEHIPAFEHDSNTPIKIMVTRAGRSHKSGESQSFKPDAGLANTYWKLIELDGQPVSPGANQRELHMVLTSEGNKVSGFSGCNRFMGGYEQSEGQLQFGQLASTMMACMENMEQEKHFLDALARAKRFNISSESLVMYSDEEQLILRFESVYLK